MSDGTVQSGGTWQDSDLSLFGVGRKIAQNHKVTLAARFKLDSAELSILTSTAWEQCMKHVVNGGKQQIDMYR